MQGLAVPTKVYIEDDPYLRDIVLLTVVTEQLVTIPELSVLTGLPMSAAAKELRTLYREGTVDLAHEGFHFNFGI